MSTKPGRLELKVGLFVLIGFVVIAAMAVQFGRMGQALKQFYTLTVRLPNAGGIIKGSDVLLAGARIGFVADKPQIDPKSVNSVTVNVKIDENIKLPKATEFSVGSSGLLGDRFIQVEPTSEFDAAEFDPDDLEQIWKDGDVVEGIKAGGGISELTSKGGVVMDDIRKSLTQVQEAVTSMQKGVLNEENFKNLQQTFVNLKTTSENFVKTSRKINSVVQDAGELVESAKTTVDDAGQTMATANYAAEDIRKAIGDARKAINTARKVIASVQGAMNEVTHGDGIIAELLTSQELADDLEALVSNLRKHGVLFYRDSAESGNLTVNPPLRERRPLITGGRGH